MPSDTTTPRAIPLLIDAKAAAGMLSMSTRRLAQLVAGGSVPSVKVGGMRRLRPEELLKWVQDGCPVRPDGNNDDAGIAGERTCQA